MRVVLGFVRAAGAAWREQMNRETIDCEKDY